MYTLIKRSVASLSGPGLLIEIPNFLFYKTLRGLGLPLMVKVFVVLSVNFSEIQQRGPPNPKSWIRPCCRLSMSLT